MGLTQLERRAFVLFNRMYSHWYPFLFTWNDDFSQVHLLSPLLPVAIPYILVVILNIGFSISGALTALFFNKLQILLKVRTMDMLVLLMSAFGRVAVFVMVPITISCTRVVNLVIQMEGSLLEGITKIIN